MPLPPLLLADAVATCPRHRRLIVTEVFFWNVVALSPSCTLAISAATFTSFFKFLPSCQLLFLLYQFAAWSLTNCIERIVADVAAAVPHRLVWFATEQREGRGVA